MMTSGNQVIRIRASEIRKAGRSTKGVRLQRLEEGDEVIAVTNLGEQTKQIADITGEASRDGQIAATGQHRNRPALPAVQDFRRYR